jgi:hypothetical protein
MNVRPCSAHLQKEILRILEPLRERTRSLLSEMTIIAPILLASSDETTYHLLAWSALVSTLLALRDQDDGSGRQLVSETTPLRNAI